MLTRLLAMVALITAAGTTGVFVGRAQRSPDAGWQRGYSAGVRAERNAERHEAQRVAANYQRGAAGYTSIYAKGRREGQRLGRKLGRSEGVSAARRQGFRAGRATALPAFAGGWRAQQWCLVRVEGGRHIASRVLVARGRVYGPCAQNPDRICSTPGLWAAVSSAATQSGRSMSWRQVKRKTT